MKEQLKKKEKIEEKNSKKIEELNNSLNDKDNTIHQLIQTHKESQNEFENIKMQLNKKLDEEIGKYNILKLELEKSKKDNLKLEEENSNKNNLIKTYTDILEQFKSKEFNDFFKLVKKGEMLLDNELKKKNNPERVNEFSEQDKSNISQKVINEKDILILYLKDILSKNLYSKKNLNEEIKNYINTNRNSQKKNYGLVGLSNTDLNCFMNCVIQNLKNIPKFSKYILNLHVLDEPILLKFKEIISNLIFSNGEAVKIDEFRKEFIKENKFLSNNNDSSIFLVGLLNTIHKHINKYKKKNNKTYQINNKQFENPINKFEFWEKNYRENNNSFIIKLFYGYQMNTTLCSKCQYGAFNFQSFCFLDFPVYQEKNKLNSLFECFNCFLMTSDQSDKKNFDCPKCHEYYLSTQTFLLKLPQILIINLKRRGEKYIYNHNIDIPFTLETQKIEKLKHFNLTYDLNGFISYVGENGGHNIAYCKNMFDQKWYLFNDAKVYPLDNLPKYDKALILFYTLRERNIQNYDLKDIIDLN